MFPGSVCGDCGAIVGNRPEALPPGLSVGSWGADPVRVPSGSDVVTPGRAGVGRTVMAADAAGSVRRFAALAVAVRLTDEAAAAVRGTVTCAWSCRWAEVALTAKTWEDLKNACHSPNPAAITIISNSAPAWHAPLRPAEPSPRRRQPPHREVAQRDRQRAGDDYHRHRQQPSREQQPGSWHQPRHCQQRRQQRHRGEDPAGTSMQGTQSGGDGPRPADPPPLLRLLTIPNGTVFHPGGASILACRARPVPRAIPAPNHDGHRRRTNQSLSRHP